MNILNNDANTIDAECEYSTSEEHREIRANELNIIFWSDVPVANSDHSHCGPVKRVVILCG